MPNLEHLAIIKRGVRIWNKWKDDNPDIMPNLAGAELSHLSLDKIDLSNADLDGINLKGCGLRHAQFTECAARFSNLSGAILDDALLDEANFLNADLSKASLIRASFLGAVLRSVDLKHSVLTNANLSGAFLNDANLQYTNLEGADLAGASFVRAQLSGAKLSGAQFGWTALDLSDMGQIEGLDEVIHEGPSSISVSTLYRSAGYVPESFLRKCGVAESFVKIVGTLVAQAKDMYSCFLSYSHKDEEFALKLYDELTARGLRVWYAPEDMSGGKKLHSQIQSALATHDRLLIVLSENSISSPWVISEILWALKRESLERRQILFPIRLMPMDALKEWTYFDADSGQDIARLVRDYYIPDFQNWKEEDQFRIGFEGLLRDLRKDEK